MADKNFITQIDVDGVEYFTKKDGESGMSISGVARCCGITQQSASAHLSHRRDDWKLCPEGGSVTGRRGKARVVVVKDTVCAEMIIHYAKQGRPEAINHLAAFASIGIRTFIQNQTGWVRPTDLEVFMEKHLLREPRAWEIVFDRQWIQAAERATGWSWGAPCMRHCINRLVYDRLPDEVRERLDDLNPVLPTGHRAKKQHQFFSPESVEQVLKMQVEIARSLLLVSTSWDEVKENARRRFEGMAQLRLPTS